MATVPVTRTWVAGEVVTAAHFNTNIRDVFNYLLASPILEARQIVAQTLATSTGAAVTMTAEDVDSSGMHSITVNTSRATAVYPGWYRFSGRTVTLANAVGRRVNWWTTNAAQLNSSQISSPATAANDCGINATTKNIFMNVGDYTELIAYQESGGNLNTDASALRASGMSAKWDSN
jgi:hypothetical protein